MSTSVRTRFAPSPTGSLHVGNARLAVLNWLFARHHDGSFVLRIEDTDVERNAPGSEAAILRDLAWLGLAWDEGPTLSGGERGDHGPYRQSQRTSFYVEAAQRLERDGRTYRCWCSDEEIAARRTTLEEGAIEAPDPCRTLTRAQVAEREASGVPPALRFRTDVTAPVIVHDVVRGAVEFAPETIPDFVVLRSDARPTYNFGVVVDDIAMDITHVIRGVGHLSNTPRQVLLFDALDARLPVFAHIPTVLDPERRKLSKRTGAQALADYRAQGFHPDALVNYLSLLSWSSPTGEEVLTREQLVAEVSLDRIGASDVVFDPVKLRWLSGKHIEHMSADALAAAVEPFLAEPPPVARDLLPEALTAVRTHLETFADAPAQLATLLPPDAAAAEDEAARAVLAAGAPVLAAGRDVLATAEWETDALAEGVREIGRRAGAKGRALYEPLRVALTGSPHGPPLTAVLRVQGREQVLARLAAAVDVSELGIPE